jgi:hypothetical protein
MQRDCFSLSDTISISNGVAMHLHRICITDCISFASDIVSPHYVLSRPLHFHRLHHLVGSGWVMTLTTIPYLNGTSPGSLQHMYNEAKIWKQVTTCLILCRNSVDKIHHLRTTKRKKKNVSWMNFFYRNNKKRKEQFNDILVFRNGNYSGGNNGNEKSQLKNKKSEKKV